MLLPAAILNSILTGFRARTTGRLDGPANDPDWDPRWTIWREEDVIGFHGMVWSMADWEPLVRAMEKLGAVRANYLSDDDLNPFDALHV